MRKARPTNPKYLYWGQGCRTDEKHSNEEHKTLRIKGVGCVLCLEKYAGMTAEQIQKQIEDEFAAYVPTTPEMARQKQIEHSRNWTKRNMEKHNQYQRTYWDNLSEEKREERKRKQRENYLKNREKIIARNRAWHEKQKALKAAQKEQDGHKRT